MEIIKNKVTIANLVLGVIVVILVIVVVFQQYQITRMSGGVTGKTISAEQILAEIMPTGTPDYGAEAGVSYDNVEGSLRILTGYHSSISLNGNDEQRYIDIATTPDTACEYCCGIGNAGFGTSTGKIACGCSHNVAFGGLTKWLIENTDYTDKQIVNEIQKWKILFFPKDAVKEEMQRRGVSGQAVLPSMVGGC